MDQKEKKTLTGGMGNLPGNTEDTLTGGIGVKTDDPDTLTGGIGVEAPDPLTLTGGIGVETPDPLTLTGGIGADARDSATLTGGIGAKTPESQTLTGGRFAKKRAKSADPKLFRTGLSGSVTSERKKRRTRKGASSSDWNVGEIIDDKYEVTELVGQGGMGVVFKIRHLVWNIDMAVKMPLERLLFNPAYKLRFLRESQTWVDLGLHPNIVQCWYAREMGRIPRLFMDYVRGGSLRDRIKGKKIGSCDWETILDLMIQAADGLAYAHERGVVHRDVKPANMLITHDGRVCVTDFGLVKVAGESEVGGDLSDGDGPAGALPEPDIDLTRPGAVLGTPEYSSPEQWDMADKVDGRADIYALGIVLYEICCGRRPFDNGKHRDPPMVLMGRHKYSPVPNPLKFNKKIEKPILRTISRCLAKDADERPASMAEFRKELAGVYREILGKPYPKPVPEPGDLRADSLNNKAVSLWDLGKKNEALAAFEDALECDPQHLEATRNLCVYRWKEGTITDQAFLDRLEALEAVHGTRADYWRHSGEVRFARGDLAEAEGALEKALKIDTNDTDAACLLAEIRNACQSKPAGPGPALNFKGQAGAVNCLRQGKEPQYYYSGGSDGKIGLWETYSGKPLAFFPMHSGPINAVSISSNGQVGLSAGADKIVKLWNASTGKHLRTFKGHSDAVNFVCFTPDGRFALSGSSDTSLRFWDLATEECVKEYTGHDGPVTCAAITPDGQTVLSSNANWAFAAKRKTDTRFHLPTVTEIPLRLWNAGDCECRFSLKGHAGNVYTVAVSPDGRFGLSGGDDRILRVWRLDTGRQIRTLEGHAAPIMSAAFGPEGRAISGGQDKTMRLWDLETGRCLRTFEDHSDSVTAVAFLKKGFAMTASRDGLMKMWRIRFPYKTPEMTLSRIKELKTLKEEKSVCGFLANKADTCLDRGEVSEAVEVLRKAREIEGFERDSELLDLWHRAAEQSVRIGLRSAWPAKVLKGHSDSINCLAVTPDGRYCLSGSADNSVGLWDLANGKCVRYFRWYSFVEAALSVRKYEGRTDSVFSVAVDPEGLTCVSGGYFKTILVWDLATGECVRVLDGHAESVNCVAISPDGRTVLSGSRDKKLIVWDCMGRRIRTMEGHVESVNAVAVSPNSGFVLSGGEDGFLRLWKLASGECVHVLKGHSAGINTVAFSPDGWMGISGSSDGSLRLWHLVSGRSLLVLKGKSGPVHSAAFTPDGRYALSASGRTVWIWDLITGERLRSLDGHSGTVNAVAVDPKGRYAFTGSADKNLTVWELDWDLRQCGTAASLTECYGINERKSFSLACSAEMARQKAGGG